ncbi:MAG: hypothetical protein FWD65_00615 [Coriobacteriia bacterium]|nr:hypothetical protein [Coriobacteriia bacterium]
MAIDKKNSPLWYRVVVWIVLIGVLVGMAAAGLFQVFSGGLNTGNSSPNSNSVSTQDASDQTTVNAINAQYQPLVTTQLTTLKSKPDDFDANKNVAQTYFLWAQDLMNSTSVQAKADATARYQEAVPYLKKANSLKPTDASVANFYVQALAYSSDQAQALVVAREVTKKIPANAEAWANLGYLLTMTTSSDKNAKTEAIAAFRTAIEKGASGTLKTQIQQEIDKLNTAQ